MSGVFGKLLESFSSGRKRQTVPKESFSKSAQQLLHPEGLSVPKLDPNRLRVVVFRDEKGAKQAIFDSQQFTSAEGEEQCTRSLCDMRHGECLDSSLSSSSNGGVAVGVTPGSSSTRSAGWIGHSSSAQSRRGLFSKRQSTDSELLGEMMFGSMPMKVVGNSVKVHYIRSTDQLMLSKVFTSQRRVLAQCSITDFTDSCPLPRSSSPSRSMERSFTSRTKNNLRHISPDVSHTPSATLSVPISSSSRRSPSSRPSSSLSSSTHSPPSPVNSLTVPSLASSLSRRIQRSRSTSLENASELYRKVLKPLDQPNGSGRKRRKYAIGFIICLSDLRKTDIRHFQAFVFSHFTLIDAHLERLKLSVEEAYCCGGGRGQSGVAEEVISKAYETFLQDFLSLYSTPRIESPVWLSLVSHVERRKEVCRNFMEEFAAAIVQLDTKETKFFLSSLLTAVLSHHLAWIFTVSHHQHQSSSDASRHGKHSSSKSLGVLAESHPYNPLWAQLGDLLGSVSTPLKISRTVVTGQVASIICRLLYVLTYFIRCSEVEPGFTTLMQDLSSPPPPPPNAIPTSSRTPGVTIPTSFSFSSTTTSSSIGNSNSNSNSNTATTVATTGDTSSLSYDVSQLDEADVFGSRASSVTVISEHDRHSLLSPYASPVNHGMDTPIVRPHPFGIRTTTSGGAVSSASSSLSQLVSPSDSRKGVGCVSGGGSQSESDSIDSFTMRLQEPVARQLKKNACNNNNSVSGGSSGSGGGGDLSTPQGWHTPLRKNSPLLSSSRQTGLTGSKGMSHNIVAVAATAGCHGSNNDNVATSAVKEGHHHCNCHYGNPNTCAVLACCESMGMCPIPDGFLAFNPHQKAATGLCNHPSGYKPDSEFSLNYLASCGLLGPAHSLESTSSSVAAPPSRASCSSLDSGYEQSWSLTESSRNSCSCAELPGSFGGVVTVGMGTTATATATGGCFSGGGVVVGPPAGPMPPTMTATAGRFYAHSESDSGRGSQCFLPEKKGCQRALFAESAASPAGGRGFKQNGFLTTTSTAKSLGGGREVKGRDEPSKQLPPSLHLHPLTGGIETADISKTLPQQQQQQPPPTKSLMDPHSSIFPMKLSHYNPPGGASDDGMMKDPDLPSPLSSESLDNESEEEGVGLSSSSPPSQELSPTLPPGALAVSSDPMAPLPIRKLKNHIRTISQAKGKEGRVNSLSSNFQNLGSDLNSDPNSDLCSKGGQDQEMEEEEDSLGSALSAASLNSALRLRQRQHEATSLSATATTAATAGSNRYHDTQFETTSFNNTTNTLPMPRPLHPPSSSSSLTPPPSTSSVSPTPSPAYSTSLSALPPHDPSPLFPSMLSSSVGMSATPATSVTAATVPATMDCQSVWSEVDSGHGTKSSLRTTADDFDTCSLSQISELSCEFDPPPPPPPPPDASLSRLALLSQHRTAGMLHCASSLPSISTTTMTTTTSTDAVTGQQQQQQQQQQQFQSFRPFIVAPQGGNEAMEVCSLDGVCTMVGGDGGSSLIGGRGLGGARSADSALKRHIQDIPNTSSSSKASPSHTHHHNQAMPPTTSVLHQQLHHHERSLMTGARPSTLEQFDNFTDVPLPDLEDFHLDTPPTHGRHDNETDSHRLRMSDFGHSLFVGLSPRYLPDFVLHGTSESADQTFQDKFLKDLAHSVKYSVIDEPVEYGVGIVADTDSWTVKVVAASKSIQTSDVIYGSGAVQPARCVREMLSSIKNMHCLRMPAEFCLSYVEDSLMSLNDRSIMLADSLLEKGGSAELSEILPKLAESLCISASDMHLLLPVAAVNCGDTDMAARLNYHHMQQTLGKHFI